MKKWGLLGASGVCFIVLGTLIISSWFERNPVAGGMMGATLLFLVLVTLAAGMFYLGASWAEQQVRLGAHIATKAQQIDNAADERKTAALAQFARHMIQMGNRQPSVIPSPLLPSPVEDDVDWLPPLSDIREGTQAGDNDFA